MENEMSSLTIQPHDDITTIGTKPYFSRVKHIPQSSFRDSTVAEVIWSDKYFEEKLLPQAKIKDWPMLRTGVEAGRQFLNFYVTGEPPRDILKVWYSLIFNMKLPKCDIKLMSDTLIDSNSRLELVLSTSSSTILTEFNTYVAATDSGQSASEAMNVASKLPSFKPGELALPIGVPRANIKEWYDLIRKLLDSNNPDEPLISNDQNQLAVNYLGYLAMTLLRISVKPADSVTNHLTTFFNTRFSNFWGLEMIVRNPLPAPNGKTLHETLGSFNRFTENSKLVLAALVETFTHPRANQVELTKGILRSACLLSLQKVGLGCYHWAVTAAISRKQPIPVMLQYLATDTTLDTTHAITMMLINYLDPKRKQYTWPWARMFEDGAFIQLATQTDIDYAMTAMAISIGADPTSIMWDIPQFARGFDIERKTNAIDWAKAILAEIRERGRATGRNELSIAGLNRIVRSKPLTATLPPPGVSKGLKHIEHSVAELFSDAEDMDKLNALRSHPKKY